MTEATKRWVRFEIEIELQDPWTLMPPLQEDGARLMAWSAPSRQTAFVAIGSMTEFRPTGTTRFDEARSWWEPIAKQMDTQNEDGLRFKSRTPACVAGFAFRSDANRSELTS